jgi:hypothetical protein
LVPLRKGCAKFSRLLLAHTSGLRDQAAKQQLQLLPGLFNVIPTFPVTTLIRTHD